MKDSAFWEDPEQVDIFAKRDPDVRLLNLLDSFEHPEQTKVLDLGCAGGRNAVVLAGRGFDAYAIDYSSAMVKKTRERVEAIIGPKEAKRRVRVGNMNNLQAFASGFFQLIVSLGVYHNAGSQKEWNKALDESERVLAPGGRVLVANFGPRSDPNGEGLSPVEGELHVYEGFRSGRLSLLAAEDLDVEFEKRGLRPAVATETVAVKTANGYRITVNGFYTKAI